jgi:TatD DNase family protein
MLVDSHCHLDFPDFDGDRDDLVVRARAAGVTKMVTICTRASAEPTVRAIAEAHDEVWYAMGAHPLNVGEAPLLTVDELITYAAHPKMVGIGETGLDYHYDKWPPDMQKQSLRRHIVAARETGLPLIIHSRDADDDMAAILREGYAEGPYSCVMHCFSSGRALAEAALEMGFYLSMSGVVTFKNAADLRAIFADAPVDRILVETDAPYLAPVPKRGKRNEPAYVAHTAATGAEIFGMDTADFAKATTANFHRLFTKVPA